MNVYLIAHQSPSRLAKAIRQGAEAIKKAGLGAKEADAVFLKWQR